MGDSPSKADLIREAEAALKRAYAPYSNYPVGAALAGKSGRIYTGCNVENSSFGLTICAERTAVVKAVSEGETEFQAIAVATLNGGTPCGACRQVLFEFMPPDAPVTIVDEEGHEETYRVGDLLPSGFGPAKLPGRQGRPSGPQP